MSVNISGNEDLYDPQSTLILCEHQRMKLEQDLKRLMIKTNKSDYLRQIQLKSQMENLKSQRQNSFQRNAMIKKQMLEFESTLTNVSARTHRLRLLKDEYENHIERLYPQWKDKVITKVHQQRERERKLSSIKRDFDIPFNQPYGETSPNAESEMLYSELYENRPPHQNKSGGFYEDHNPHRASRSFRDDDSDSNQEPYLRSSSVSSQPFPQPQRSSTPNLYKPTEQQPQTEMVSASLQSLTSEKSVTFDEENLKSLRRNSLQKENRISTLKTAISHTTASGVKNNKEVTKPNENLTEHLTVSAPSAREKLPGNSLHSHETSPAPDATSDFHTADPCGLEKPNTIQTGSPEKVNAEREIQNKEKMAIESLQAAVPRVVIPSVGDTGVGDDDDAEDDDDVDSFGDIEDILDSNVMKGPSPQSQIDASISDSPSKVTISAGEQPAVSAATVPPEISQSLSSMNTTVEEEREAEVDITNTAEFKNLITGNIFPNRNADDSDSSEDSMEAVEKAYKQLALNKTNTMPVGHDMKQEEIAEPSEAEESDEESVTAPMGYTPSFATNTVGKSASAQKESQLASYNKNSTLVVTDDGSSNVKKELQTISSTGSGSLTSTGKKKPAFLRTESDIDSESDVEASNKKVDNNDDIMDDFDFYG